MLKDCEKAEAARAKGEEVLAALQLQADAKLNILRREKPCSLKARKFWGGQTDAEAKRMPGNGDHLRHVFEVVKTEDTYVRELLFMRHVWYLPLATGTHGAPKLEPGDLDTLFSTLFSREEVDAEEDALEASDSDHDDDELEHSPRRRQPSQKPADGSQRKGRRQSAKGTAAGVLARNMISRGFTSKNSGITDILTFQLEHFMRSLLKEERKERPNIPLVFLQRCGSSVLNFVLGACPSTRAVLRPLHLAARPTLDCPKHGP